MLEGILGRKIGMTQIFDAQGDIVPVTVIEAGPCVVVGKKTRERDNYNALQVGFGRKREKSLPKAQKVFFAKNNLQPTDLIREFKTEDLDKYTVGQEVKADIFQVGDYVDISGISKGKGYSGVIKKCGYTGGRATHGSMFHRKPGSIGSSSFPSRVFKGLDLPGHLGNTRATSIKLEIVIIDLEKNVVLVKGSVPGNNKSYVVLQRTKKALKHAKPKVKKSSTEQKLVKKPSKKKVG